MDKNEFFILTTLRHDNKMDLLEEMIQKYRDGSLGELEIAQNVNDYNYITKLFIQSGVLEEKPYNKGVGFTEEYLKMEEV